MKALIVASYAYSLVNFRAPLLKALIKNGISVHVAAPGLASQFTIRRKLEAIGVTCHDIQLQRNGLNPLHDIRMCYQLFRLMKHLKVDLYMGYTIKPVIWGGIAAWLANVPRRFALITGLGYAFTGRAEGLRWLVQQFARLLYKLSLRKMTLVFFQNPDDLDEFLSAGLLPKGCATRVLNGSGVDIDWYGNVPLPRLNSIDFLLVARLLGDKGIREYVAAARQISSRYTQIIFHLVGGLDTNPNAISKDEVNGWVKEGLVNWYGAVDDIRPFITNSHIYVLPSYREGTPRSVLEAMSMGRPIITTDAPGCRETVIDGENGFLVDVKSVEQLVAAMERFIKQPELIESMGKRSREIACEKYDVHKVNDVMLKAMGIIKE